MNVEVVSPGEGSLSPSLVKGVEAYELKFVVPSTLAASAEAWARSRLAPDPHGRDGVYWTTSLYCDTPRFDVYHRASGYRRSKYRIRRYDSGAFLHLERKTRRGDRVRKRREVFRDDLDFLLGPDNDVEPDNPAAWFVRQVRFRDLRPVCRVGYERTAFMGTGPEGPVRLTLDRGLVGGSGSSWMPDVLNDGLLLLGDSVVLEMKYQTVLPSVFRELLAELPVTAQRASKYRLCVDALGLAVGGPS